MKHYLLFSGGLDSCLLFNMKKTTLDGTIFFRYGHKHMDRELEEVLKKDPNPIIVDLPALPVSSTGFFYGRNLRFFIAARERFIDEDICLYFGNCADDNYDDNTREFLARVEKIINDSYPTKTLRIICPLENMAKAEIAALSDGSGYWCDKGEKEPCGLCHSCQAMIDAGLMNAPAR